MGRHLYVLALTAVPTTALANGIVYLYDLEFEASGGESTATLRTPGIITPPGSTDDPSENFAYDALSRPTFPSALASRTFS